jgi:hypothetical protein
MVAPEYDNAICHRTTPNRTLDAGAKQSVVKLAAVDTFVQ